MTDDDYRVEEDSLGEMRVPADAYWGARPSGPPRTSLSPG